MPGLVVCKDNDLVEMLRQGNGDFSQIILVIISEINGRVDTFAFAGDLNGAMQAICAGDRYTDDFLDRLRFVAFFLKPYPLKN